MKRILLVGVVAMIGMGVYSLGPQVSAREMKRFESPLTPPDNHARWDAWLADFYALLEADDRYVAAEEALHAYVGDDEAEHARLEAIRTQRYRDLAMEIYETHFGVWSGSEAEFDLLIAVSEVSVLTVFKVCSNAALSVCGQGRVCGVNMGSEGCAFACGDGHGRCPKQVPASTKSN